MPEKSPHVLRLENIAREEDTRGSGLHDAPHNIHSLTVPASAKDQDRNGTQSFTSLRMPATLPA